jgi:hypothetical protein
MAPPFLASALDGGVWSTLRSYRFIPGKRAPGTHWIGGWVGRRAGPDAAEKNVFPVPGMEARPSSPEPVTILCYLFEVILWELNPGCSVLLVRYRHLRPLTDEESRSCKQCYETVLTLRFCTLHITLYLFTTNCKIFINSIIIHKNVTEYCNIVLTLFVIIVIAKCAAACWRETVLCPELGKGNGIFVLPFVAQYKDTLFPLNLKSRNSYCSIVK